MSRDSCPVCLKQGDAVDAAENIDMKQKSLIEERTKKLLKVHNKLIDMRRDGTDKGSRFLAHMDYISDATRWIVQTKHYLVDEKFRLRHKKK